MDNAVAFHVLPWGFILSDRFKLKQRFVHHHLPLCVELATNRPSWNHEPPRLQPT
jgi:hypothetical protein